MYYMYKYYEGKEIIDTDDLITAIKTASNYEADLYKNGRLIMSCLGLSHEDNAENLTKLGVIQYYKNGYLAWKYEDESKNIMKFFVSTHLYNYEGKQKVNVMIYDYRHYRDDIEFNTLEEAKNYLASEFGEVVEEFTANCLLDNENYDLKYVQGQGWLEDRMYYIIGVDSSNPMFSPPQLLCVQGDDQEKAIARYINIKHRTLLESEKKFIKVFGTSRSYVSGKLEEYLKKESSNETPQNF